VLDNEVPTSTMAVLSGHQSATTTPGQDGEAQGSSLLEAVLQPMANEDSAEEPNK